MSFRFGFRRPQGGSTLRDFNARGGRAAPAPRFCLRQNARTAHPRRRPEGRVGAVLSACFENIQIVEKVTSHKKGLLQNAVFRPGKKICALKKLAKTAGSTVLANFFFGLIFQNFILQQAHLRLSPFCPCAPPRAWQKRPFSNIFVPAKC